MSIRPLDEQICPLDIHMSIRPMDEQKCPFVHWANRNVQWTFKCPFVQWTNRNVQWTFKGPLDILQRYWTCMFHSGCLRKRGNFPVNFASTRSKLAHERRGWQRACAKSYCGYQTNAAAALHQYCEYQSEKV